MAAVAAQTLGPVLLHGRDGAWQLEVGDGRITAMDPAVSAAHLALPAFADLHVHADRAFATGERPPRSLADAIELVREIKLSSTEQAVCERATRLFQHALAHGTLRVRTHVDVDELIGDRGLNGVLDARQALAGRLDVEIVAFATKFADPTTAAGLERLRWAGANGADFLGGVPAFHRDPVESIERVLDLAVDLDLPVDLHVDEASVPDAFVLEALADATMAHGLQGRVTASHTCALATVDPATASRTIAKLAEARIMVIVLPALNLFLQGRGDETPRVRGITLVRELLAAGVDVRFGSDNVRDVFYPYGDADPLEAGWLAAVTAHVDDDDALLAGIAGGRSRLEIGDAADLVLVDAPTFGDALSRRPADRTVIRAGSVVSGEVPA
jgi:cytosine deaminase